MKAIDIGDALFTRTQQRVLGLLYGMPDRSFYTNEIVRRAQVGRGAVGRELERLVASGLLMATRAGNQRHYQANPRNPIHQELASIVKKTFGVADVIKAALAPVESQIALAFIYGSLAKGGGTAASDIDLLVVADSLGYADLMTALAPAEQTLGRPVNPSLYTAQQLSARLRQKNAFATRLMQQPKLWIKESPHAIGELA